METFHGKQSIKDKYIKRLEDHQQADNIIKGRYWENGKGCAIGCTIEGNDHSKYETELGIPEWLAHLEDKIFEGLQNEEAKVFPLEFLRAMPIGVSKDELYKLRCDLDFFRLSNLLQNLESDEYGVEEAIKTVMRLNVEYAEIEDGRWLEAESAAESARSANVSMLKDNLLLALKRLKNNPEEEIETVEFNGKKYKKSELDERLQELKPVE